MPNKLIKCACGCGEAFLEKDCNGRRRRFVSGHNKKSIKTLREIIFNNYTVTRHGCWEWQGSLDPYGYGKFGYRNKTVSAHRAAYQIANKHTFKEGECVCHSCDNPKCINPEHLFIGTQLDNIHDSIKKNRMPGAATGLLNADVVLIRQMYQPGVNTQLEIAKLFKVDQTAISQIVLNKARKNVPSLSI